MIKNNTKHHHQLQMSNQDTLLLFLLILILFLKSLKQQLRWFINWFWNMDIFWAMFGILDSIRKSKWFVLLVEEILVLRADDSRLASENSTGEGNRACCCWNSTEQEVWVSKQKSRQLIKFVLLNVSLFPGGLPQRPTAALTEGSKPSTELNTHKKQNSLLKLYVFFCRQFMC